MGWGMKQESDKHKAEREERERIKRVVRRRDRSCRARLLYPEHIDSPDLDPEAAAAARQAWPTRCGGPLDIHEIIPRSAWRAGYLVPDNCVLICRNHHDWVDHWPDAAHVLGLHGYSWERPDQPGGPA